MQHAAVAAIASTATPIPAPLSAASLQLVNAAPLAAPANSRDLDCLAAAVYYESRGESAAGQAAVAQVVLTRTHLPSFPGSVCGVVYQGAAIRQCQFSFACDGSAHRRREPAAWAAARRVAARALDGYVMPQVSRAAYFHAAALGSIWGHGMVRVAQVGQQVFYSRVGHSRALVAALRVLRDDAAAAPAEAGSTVAATTVSTAPDAAPSAASADAPAAAIVSAAS